MLTRIFGTRFSTLGTRAVDMGSLLDTVMIFAVATILIIRTHLWLTNYPQLGGNGLHIAHLLWGGLGMLIAIAVLLSFLSPAARQAGAVVGGVGLGFFIDELGKFLTSDNNYFFKPTAAILYIFFVAFYLVARALTRRREPTPRECLVNAIEVAKDAASGAMTAADKREAEALLARADQSDPLVERTRALLDAATIAPDGADSAVTRAGRWARDRYLRLVRKPWFERALIALFAVWAVGTLLEVVEFIAALHPHLDPEETIKIRGAITSRGGDYGFVEWADLASSLLGGFFVVWGLVRLRRSRAAAYEMFERALLVSIFFTQVFAFIESQFGAVIGLLVDLALFYTVRVMLAGERELSRARAEGPAAPTRSRSPGRASRLVRRARAHG